MNENIDGGSDEFPRVLDVSYFLCPECGFVQTEEPYWLDEAYSDAITDSDIGLIQRNYNFAQKVASILKLFFPKADRCLDFGGYGIFVRLMRDYGFNFEWYDEYCTNLFAKGFEQKNTEDNNNSKSNTKNYDVLTAFELFEHLPNPIEDITPLLAQSQVLIFTTTLLPEPTPKATDWWYYSPETGQHISFYTRKALRILAEKAGLKYSSYGDFHIFAPQKHISAMKIHFALRGAFIVNKLMKRRSLLLDDYKAITGRELA